MCRLKLTLTMASLAKFKKMSTERHQKIRSVPGNMTLPRIISPIMHPTDQISTKQKSKMDKLVYKLQSWNLNIPLTNIYLMNSTTGVKPGELEVRDPRFWGGVSMKYYSFLKCKEI